MRLKEFQRMAFSEVDWESQFLLSRFEQVTKLIWSPLAYHQDLANSNKVLYIGAGKDERIKSKDLDEYDKPTFVRR